MTKRTCPTRLAVLQDHGVTEDDLIGKQADEVPQVPPDRLCNAKKVENGTGVFEGYCKSYAGERTETDEGRCGLHGGSDDVGAPENNQNARTHGLSADPKKYAANLEREDPEEAEWIRDVSATIEDRIRANTGDVDPLDRVLARRLAIRLHIAAGASDYVQREGLMETIWTDEGRQDVKNRLMEELRMYDKDIVQDLKRIGVLDDPDSQKASALENWREYISEGH